MSSSFEATNGHGQQCLISLFSYNFVIEDEIQDPLGGLQDVDMELANGKNLCDYTGDHLRLFEFARHVQITLFRVATAVAGLCNHSNAGRLQFIISTIGQLQYSKLIPVKINDVYCQKRLQIVNRRIAVKSTWAISYE